MGGFARFGPFQLIKKGENKMNKNKLDNEIDREYGKQAQGKQIELSKIVPFWDYCRKEIASGVNVSDAVKAGIAIYCENA